MDKSRNLFPPTVKLTFDEEGERIAFLPQSEEFKIELETVIFDALKVITGFITGWY